jgi:ATP-dependent Clp protease adaptor protein ClpS
MAGDEPTPSTPDPTPAQTPSHDGPAEDRQAASPQTATAVAERPEVERQTDTKPLPPFNVVLLDDDQHTYEYVIELAMKLFAHPRERAFDIAKMVDTQKRAVLLTTHKEHAELKREQVHGFGRDYRMANCKGSMSCIIEPAFADGDTTNNGNGSGKGGNSGAGGNA